MRAKCLGFALWIGVGLIALCAGRTLAQPGRDDGAVLRSPFDDPAPRPKSNSATPQTLAPSPGANEATGAVAFDQILANLTIDPRYAMNHDIAPKGGEGPWMICVHSYVTKEAPEWAREMTAELRSRYKLPAYVFTYGLEERRKEYARVKELIDRQQRFQNEKELPILFTPRKGDGDGKAASPIMSQDLPLAYAMRMLKVQHMPVQCAVLVGGYANEDAAHRALLSIRKLPPPDPTRVKLDTKFYGKDEDPDRPGKLKRDGGETVHVNPFPRAFCVRNPAVKQDRTTDGKDVNDIEVLRQLNNDETLSLLQCRKPITLAIKQFQTFTTVESKENARSILEKLGFKTRNGDGADQAATDAHNLAEMLRKNKLEAYVLHTRFNSVVTIGGYDSLEDPNLRSMQKILESRLQSPEWAQLRFFPLARPMQVPR